MIRLNPMSIRFNKARADATVREAAEVAESGKFDEAWFKKIERLSELCAIGVSKTHIAFLGTTLIAKAMRLDVDLFAIKPKYAPENPRAFSARTLCHTVLVPLAGELDMNIGVTGREPLNNQPYFRMTRLGDGTPVHQGARAAFDCMVELIRELDRVSDEKEAQGALAAFIAERRQQQVRYMTPAGSLTITARELSVAIRTFVQDNSEGGRRAQAVVAGLMDVFAGPERVVTGRVNDPSRGYPGDVCVRDIDDPNAWEKAFEVRDKPVILSDVRIFGRKCQSMGVREAAVVATANGQAPLNDVRLSASAGEPELGVTLFTSWEAIVAQTLFWANDSGAKGASRAVGFIHLRLVTVEAIPSGVELWAQLTRQGQINK